MSPRIGDSGVRGLDHEKLRILQKQLLQAAARVKGRTKSNRRNAIRLTGYLHECFMGRAVVAVDHRQSCDSFVSRNSDFHVLIRGRGAADHRGHSASWEIQMLNLFVRTFERSTALQRNRLQM